MTSFLQYFSGEKIKSIFINTTTKDIGIILISTTIVNLTNFFYQIIMGRMLGPSEYGILTTLISLLYISGAITGTFQTATTRYISAYHAQNNKNKIKKFFNMMTIRFLILSFLIFIVIILLLKPIVSFLQMNSMLPLVILGIVIIAGSLSSVIAGVIQGTERFKVFGFYSILGTSLKLILGILLVYLGFKSLGAVLGIILSMLIAYLVVLLFIKDILRLKIPDNDENSINIKDFYKSIILILISTVLLTIISYFDVVLVKHFFSSEETGYFSAASQIGKIILFFPGAIGIVIFPRLSKKFEKNENLKGTLLKSFLVLLLTSIFFLLLYYFFPELIIKIIFGTAFAEGASKLILLCGLFMSIIGFINLQIFYFISIKKFWYLIYLFVFIIIEVILIFNFHKTLQMILWIEILISVLVFVTNVIMMFVLSKKYYK